MNKAVFILVCASTACSMDDMTGPMESGAANVEMHQNYPVTANDRQYQIALQLPGFGGRFVDAAGNLVVYLTDLRREQQARSFFAPFVHRGASGIVVRQATYGWDQLYEWYTPSQAVLMAIPGVVMTDIDERVNRIRVGVLPFTDRARVRSALVARGAPDDAVIVEERQPIQVLATLRDATWPTLGGLMIDYRPGTQVPGIDGDCTLGFNVIRAGVYGWVTAAHCSLNRIAATDGTRMYQPSVESNRYFGYEAFDLPATTSTCPGVSQPCRWADAAFIAHDPQSWNPGLYNYLARTCHGIYEGCLDIWPEPYSRLRVIAEEHNIDSQFVVYLRKVGMRTGTTEGDIYLVCANFLGTDGIWRYCNYKVGGGAQPGDSGSPVYLNSCCNMDVTLYGVLWGGDDNWHSFVFSPIANVEYELGPLQTF